MNQKIIFYVSSQIFLAGAFFLAVPLNIFSAQHLFVRLSLFVFSVFALFAQNDLGPFRVSLKKNAWGQEELEEITSHQGVFSQLTQMLGLLFSAALVLYLVSYPESDFSQSDAIAWSVSMALILGKAMGLAFLVFLTLPFWATYSTKQYSAVIFHSLVPFSLVLGAYLLFIH
ncbi:hypothetical protein AGMMS49949_04160 [Alphaproteobacteria bacterium]|nr:hypothetical protein AGMMS49949_04160 [Alphaproteobacteria bacterium]GHS97138.1 hypothetical protein AGMMS50296_3890 [Alphaproteobacteria bacterium]